MALTKCKECDYKISKKANKCPNCGSPQKAKQYGCGTLLVILFFGGLLISLFIGNDSNISSPSSPPKFVTSTPEPAKSPEQKKQDYLQKLKRELDGLDKFEVGTYLDSKDSIIIGVAVFSAWAIIAEEGDKFTLNNEEKSLLENFKQKVSSIQGKSFPRLRDAYGPVVRKILWEHDLSAKTFGTGFQTIEFVGGAFASNRNIKEFQIKMRDMLHMLRFRKAVYKWYKEADKYTYYDMEIHKDSDLVIWLDKGRYRDVK